MEELVYVKESVDPGRDILGKTGLRRRTGDHVVGKSLVDEVDLRGTVRRTEMRRAVSTRDSDGESLPRASRRGSVAVSQAVKQYSWYPTELLQSLILSCFAIVFQSRRDDNETVRAL